MQSIITTYYGPTNSKSSRIGAKASSSPGSITVPFDHSLNTDGNHAVACTMLKRKLGWDGVLLGGHLSADKMCWVFKSGSPEAR